MKEEIRQLQKYLRCLKEIKECWWTHLSVEIREATEGKEKNKIQTKDYLIENRFPKTAAILIGEFYLEFPDKLLTVLALFICIKLGKMIKNKCAKHPPEKTT